MPDEINLAFVKLAPISQQPETDQAFDSWVVVSKLNGEIERVPIDKFYQFIGTIAKPISPTDTSPTLEGWYKPKITSEDNKNIDPDNWGTLYPNAGNLRAKAGFDTLFFRDVSGAWVKSESKIGNAARKMFDPDNNEDPSTMKAAFDKFGPALSALNSFVTAVKTEEIEIVMPLSGESDGTFLNTAHNTIINANAASGIIPMALLTDYDQIIVRGNTFTPGNQCMYIGHVGSNGIKYADVVGVSHSDQVVVIDKTAQYYVYSRYKGASDYPFKTQFFKSRTIKDLKIDAVKKYTDPALTVLDSFVNPSETIWQEIIMPVSGENSGQYLDSTYTAMTGTGVGWGVIPMSEFGSEWTMIKIEGDLSALYQGLWLGRYRPEEYGRGPNLVTGNKGPVASFTFNIDPQYTGFIYSRVFGRVKFYKGKTTKGLPVLDSVKKYINDNGAAAKHRFIDAFLDFNVKPENTAAQNTANMNEAISQAFILKKPIMLPAGSIRHNGFEYKPGVIIRGSGIGHTELINSGGTHTFKCLDEFDTNPYLHGGGLFDMALVGNGIADYGVEFRNMFMFKFENLWFSGYKTNSVKLTGVGAASFNYIRVFGGTGFKLLTSDSSSAGYMQANLNEFNFVYFERIPGLCVDMDRASNIVFRSCNFEFSGTAGDPNTGGVRAMRMSPGGEGVDLVFEQCWSETLSGPFLQIYNSDGNTVIRDCMVGNPGNTAANMIVNDGCKVLIDGATKVSGSPTGVRTSNNGVTCIAGLSQINSHVQQTGGVYKQVMYS